MKDFPLKDPADFLSISKGRRQLWLDSPLTSGEPFEAAYKKRQTGQNREKQLVAEIESRPAHRQAVQCRTCLVPCDYAWFGQNSKVTGKPC